MLLRPIALVLIVIFFVTSSDSGSLVIDTITAGGKMDAPVSQRIFWCTLEGLVAIALLLGGGLSALQGAAVSTGIPFTFVGPGDVLLPVARVAIGARQAVTFPHQGSQSNWENSH